MIYVPSVYFKLHTNSLFQFFESLVRNYVNSLIN